MSLRRSLPLTVALRSTCQRTPFSTAHRLSQKDDSSVQTPLQSQNKEGIAPRAVRPEGDAAIIETPLQKQNREALAPQAGQTRRKGSRAAPGLLAGMIGIPPLVYYYYQYRREHMDNKRADLLEQQRLKYANGG